MEDQKMAQAKHEFQTICRMLDNHDWNYRAEEDGLKIKTGARGDDLPMEFVFYVDPELDRVQLISFLPYDVKEDKRVDVAIAISSANHGMVQGCFDYDIAKGSIFFRMSNSYAGSLIDEELYYHMLMIACLTVDQYNDKLMLLAKGSITVEQFLKATE